MTTPSKEQTTSSQFIKRALSKLSKWAQFILGLALLIFIYLICEHLTAIFDLSVPPALMGIVMLLLILLSVRRVPLFVQLGTRPMLSHMVLFLIPAIVGIMAHYVIILQFPLVLLLAIGGTTILSMFITAVISQKLMANR